MSHASDLPWSVVQASPTPALPSAWRGRPPGWAWRCAAARSMDVEAMIRDGEWPIRVTEGPARCRNVLCPVCGPARMLQYRRTLTERLMHAQDQGLGLAVYTLTMPSVPIGQLRGQLAQVRALLAKAKEGSPYRRLLTKHGVAGHLSVVHITFGPEGWHAHLHVLVAACDQPSASSAALAITDRYRRYMHRAGIRVGPGTTDERPVYDAGHLASYLTTIWSPDDPGGPLGLLRKALDGDDRSRAAFEELADALSRLHLVRGSGVLGKPEGRIRSAATVRTSRK